MITNIQHHPDGDLLDSFTRGTLSPGLSVAIAAHTEICAGCKRHSEALEKQLAESWVGQEPEPAPFTGQQDAMLDFIVRQPQLSSVASKNLSPQPCRVENRSVQLPRVLAKAAGQGLAWKNSGSGIRQARLKLDRTAQCDFLYMSPGSCAPHHTHHGIEVTLVLDGSFHDELGRYTLGDFILRNSSDEHKPASKEGCLCFAVLDQPLRFTNGFARLLNPFQALLFNR